VWWWLRSLGEEGVEVGEPVRRALCVPVGSFGVAGAEPAAGAPQALGFAAERTGRLAAALRELGYECRVLGGDPPAQVLGARVEEFLSERLPAGAVRIVHVLSHGQVKRRGGALQVVGGDGEVHPATDVERWLKVVELEPSAAATLFLLDVCYAGHATTLPWAPTVAADPRAPVLAAADLEAFDGHFTTAVIEALEKVAGGGFDIARGVDRVPLSLVGRDICARVAATGLQQVQPSTVWFTHEIDFPFFPNPRPGPASVAADGADPGIGDLAGQLTSSLEPTGAAEAPQFDGEHFQERAYARGVFGEQLRSGLFCGRDRLLTELAGWMDRPPADSAGGGLKVVTGSPGSGKSALLGVLVCAAHPALRERTEPGWHHLEPGVPSLNEHLVAVHARQLTTQQVIDSLARQLNLTPPTSPITNRAITDRVITDGASQGQQQGWTARRLIDAVTRLPDPPLIVVDALDEAAQPRELTQQLLMPLATTTRPAPTARMAAATRPRPQVAPGHPQGPGGICRLLVGTRDWPQFSDLLELAHHHNGLIRLDAEPVTEIQTAVSDYIVGILARLRPYNTPAYFDARTAFAATLAGTLTSPDPAAPAGGDAHPRWGPFLVAALFTYHQVITGALGTDPAAAAELAAQVPRTLPEVMELDLQRHHTQPWARAFLSTLAYARGDGLPLHLLADLAPVFHPADTAQTGVPAPDLDTTRHILELIRFYLRLTPDRDGAIHYRLFHQGLADHLREYPLPPTTP
jgi:hypothetical protein